MKSHLGESHLRRWRRVRTTIWTLLKQVMLAVYGLGVRVRVVGDIALPLRRGFIVAANHLTGSDSLVIQIGLKTRLFFLTSARWFVAGIARFFLTHVCDCVPIETGQPFLSLPGLRFCLEALRTGNCVGVYPEGRLNQSGGVAAVNDGAAYLAIRTGTPILPVYVRNLKTGPAPFSRSWLDESWEGFFSVFGNVLNTDVQILVGDPIVPHPVLPASPIQLKVEIARLNATLKRELDDLAHAA